MTIEFKTQLPYVIKDPNPGQKPISIIVDGDRLDGYNPLYGTVGNLNQTGFDLQNNISVVYNNTLNLDARTKATETFIGDFSEDENTYLRYKNSWVPVNSDGSQEQMDYAMFEATEVRDNHIIPETKYLGNSKPRTSSTFSMKNPGFYKTEINGVLERESGVNPIEIIAYINGRPVDSMAFVVTNEKKISFAGFLALSVRDHLDVIHFEVVNELGITASTNRADLKILINRIGDLGNE